jgi:uncharacterized membrane protein YhiD involved in acid resistance
VMALPMWQRDLASLVLALLLAVAVSRLYVHLKGGALAARSLGATIALAGLVSAMVVLAIGESVARGLGLVGAVALVRFRSNLKEPIDLIFMFASLAAGVAVGAHAYFVGTIGTTAFIAVAWLVARQPLSVEAPETFDAILTFRTRAGAAAERLIADALAAHVLQHAMVRVRQVPGGHEHAYQVKLPPGAGSHAALFQAVERVPGVDDTQLIAYDAPEEG